jgi:ATP-dependent protease ClpP protease subunit
MPYPNFHAARIRDPKDFDHIVVLQTLPNGIMIYGGPLKSNPSGPTKTQAYRFPKSKFTVAEAKKWLKDHNITYILFEPASGSSGYSPIMQISATNKPLLLYAPIYDVVAQEFVEKMNEIPEDEDIEIWMNCPGGRVFAGWSIIGPLQKRSGNKKLSIFGHAMSMAIFLTFYCDEVEALEVTQFMLHRADAYIENDEDRVLLDNINKDLRRQMESRLNMDIFEEVCGTTMDDIFKAEKRRDVMLTAKQAKKIGLIDRIMKLTPEQVKAYSEHFVAYADFSQRSEDTSKSQRSDEYVDIEGVTDLEVNNNSNEQKNKKFMNKDELKAQQPELYNTIYNEGLEAGKKIGADQEFDRVSAHLVFVETDAKATRTAIEERKPISQKFMAEMIAKRDNKENLDNAEEDSPNSQKVDTENEPKKKGVTTEAEEFKQKVFKAAGIKGKQPESIVMK